MKSYRTALLLCVLAAGTLLICAGKPWTTDERLGTDVAAMLTSLPLVAAAGIAGIMATSGRQRQMVGIILFAAALFGLSDWFFTMRSLDSNMVWGPWPLVAVIGALSMMGSGMLTLSNASRWPVLGSRYERQTPSAGSGPKASDWQRLDDGEDPTL